MNDLKATIFDIQRNSYVDGPGIRTTVFFKGCNLNCAWCHNPESQSKKPQLMFYRNKCNSCGKCAEVCPHNLEKCELCAKCTLYCPNHAREMCGREYTVDEIFEIIIKDKRFYDASGGGVTFSGGECMLQIDFLVEILKRCHENRIPTAVDTAGHVPYSYFERILPYANLLLYDIKCHDSEMHVKYTGADNGTILKNLEKLLLTDTPIWVRIPIISGVNDSEDEMRRIKGFLESRKMPQKIELLPYHAMGEHKYSALSRELTKFSAPCEEQMRKFKDIFNISEV